MCLFDRAAAVTPPQSEQARREARQKAQSASCSGDWLSLILTHHQQIEAAYAAVKSATTTGERTTAQKKLGILLTGHSIAEESVIYPAFALAGERGHATAAYIE